MMKDQNNHLPTGISLYFLSWFKTGFLPVAPGTWGSLATIPLFFLFDWLSLPTIIIVLLILILTLVASYVAQKVQVTHKLHDPGWIVIDEVLGMMTTWCFSPKLSLLNIFAVFVLFRVFDIIKIWPASYFDRLHHGFGTIADDLVSGVYAGLILYIISLYFDLTHGIL